MDKIKGQVIVSVANGITVLEHSASGATGPLSPEDRKTLLKRLRDIGKLCAGLEVASMLDQLTRIKLQLANERPLTHREVEGLVASLIERFYDDIGRCHLLLIPSNRVALYEGKVLFGSAVYDAFPSAIYDIEEAGKCLALQRGTAAVFHLMRVMEVGLKEVARVIGIQYAPSWEAYFRQIRPKLALEWKKKSPKWRKEEPFFMEVVTHPEAVKLAWRNPTMHIVQKKSYTPDMAEDVFNAVKGFMRHLATRVNESKPRGLGTPSWGVIEID